MSAFPGRTPSPKFKARLKWRAGGEACNIVTRTKFKMLQSFLRTTAVAETVYFVMLGAFAIMPLLVARRSVDPKNVATRNFD